MDNLILLTARAERAVTAQESPQAGAIRLARDKVLRSLTKPLADAAQLVTHAVARTADGGWQVTLAHGQLTYMVFINQPDHCRITL